MTHRYPRSKPRIPHQDTDFPTNRIVFAGFWLLIFLSTFFVRGPWAGLHGIMLGVAGLLMALAPPTFSLPRSWWFLAGIFTVTACASFLPVDWFGMPAWRMELEKLGLDTGTQVVIQSRQAAENLALLVLMLLTGLWMAGHRASASQVRCWALAFTVGVAAYAVLARIMQDTSTSGAAEHYGFFRNRNHTATYLAMGTVCGLGCVLQAGRDKRFIALAFALAATAVCVWAAFFWSISRAGIVLIVAGTLAWVPMLGRRYLGIHGLWGIGIILLAGIGLFLLTETTVRHRISDTLAKAEHGIGQETAADYPQYLDFRIPIFLDTVDLIARHPLTGVGAAQFYHIFPQYRSRTITAQHADVIHPESDWLLVAAEAGILATLALLALVVLALRRSLGETLSGRDRALRSACLVAAALVPLHGLFDVPGHRISLAWSAALLFSLSLSPTASPAGRSPSPWPARAVAIVLLAASAFLMRSHLLGGSQLATTASFHTLSKINVLYREDLALQQKADEQGVEYQPAPADDPLEEALALIDRTKPLKPIDRDLFRQEGFLAIQFDDKYERVDRAFAIERALVPYRVEDVLRQARAWADINPQKSAELFREALRRAKSVDRADPNNQWNSLRTTERIRQWVAGKPHLEPLFGKDP